ncbi:hypothetical protein QNA08_17030 [Chelatococcus sp. SYSU_G07232]|uniref:Uncharacterized protein n=1 Tax=Chelatococcus albus TaxID=3047466 RepID=A0ABT7AKP4_9HYPH|nr:hypothetical protein [Chelatococcus sp. SYSU_G07232]MDJ1159923.1 hypothetical protein [Chelatococcus sp. SYSU_G07232]
MLLGDLLKDLAARLDDETAAVAIVAGLDAGAPAAGAGRAGLPLVARVQAAAARQGVTPGAFVADAVGAFTAGASDEEWMSLVGLMAREADPGRVFLRRAVLCALAAAERSAAIDEGAAA